MDGNRRFARRSQRDISVGHQIGFSALEQILETCYHLGIKVITVYAFSIDNFNRSQEEVDNLMELFREKLQLFRDESHLVQQHQVRIRVVGDLSLLPADVRQEAQKVMESTRSYNRALLNICCPYTSSFDINQAFKRAEEESQLMFSQCETSVLNRVEVDFESKLLMLDDCDQFRHQPLDLLIRTSGETRLSDFMLYEVTRNPQARIEFIDVMWPEFNFWHFLPILIRFMYDTKQQKQQKELYLDQRLQLQTLFDS
ncbi:hypothetical protein MP228_005920 [Amoeboaphelidium protococcarum]|nr:hypothetical protein MP228_005920 [Amoeboaphelidium protococcarum]